MRNEMGRLGRDLEKMERDQEGKEKSRFIMIEKRLNNWVDQMESKVASIELKFRKQMQEMKEGPVQRRQSKAQTLNDKSKEQSLSQQRKRLKNYTQGSIDDQESKGKVTFDTNKRKRDEKRKNQSQVMTRSRSLESFYSCTSEEKYLEHRSISSQSCLEENYPFSLTHDREKPYVVDDQYHKCYQNTSKHRVPANYPFTHNSV